MPRQKRGRLAGPVILALTAVVWTGEPVSSQSSIDCRDRAGFEKTICVVTGRFVTNQVFDPGSFWVLRGAVFIEDGATLTLQPGTEVFGEFATNGTLIISRGGKIESNGTADAPVVFTSDQPVGERARGDWGGLIINGRAPLNVPGGEAEGEGDTGTYGGTDPDDDSGHLFYTRVEFAGTEFSPDNELNGIAFQGVGRNTEVDFVTRVDRLLAAVAGLVVCAVVTTGCVGSADTSVHGPALLRATFASLEDLGRAVLRGVAAGDFDRLSVLALDELEFRTVVWPELPSSRPERGVPFDYAWRDLHQKSTNGLRRLVATRSGQRFDLLGVEFTGETTPYDTFVVHRDSVLVVRNEEGREQRVRFFGAVLERDGQYKLFSYVVD